LFYKSTKALKTAKAVGRICYTAHFESLDLLRHSTYERNVFVWLVRLEQLNFEGNSRRNNGSN